MRATKLWTNVYGEIIIPKDAQHRKQLESWDSKLELDTYLFIRKSFPDIAIHREPTLLLLPGTEHFKPFKWLIDFRLAMPDKSERWIECKGKWIFTHAQLLAEFRLRLQVLQKEFPEVFDSLIIVSNTKFIVPATKVKAIAIKQLKEVLN